MYKSNGKDSTFEKYKVNMFAAKNHPSIKLGWFFIRLILLGF